MATIADLLIINSEHVAEALHDVHSKLSNADGKLVLDFTSVRRIDAPAITAMEELAIAAKNKSVKLVLRGVNVDIYKVLKLSRLTTRFTFLS